MKKANAGAAVVYLKNRVSRAWQPIEESAASKRITEEDKVELRSRILPILASSQPQIRAQLIPALQKILSYDFPEKWPTFLDLTMQLLSTNDTNAVFAGLHCMLAICRMYRFKGGETRDDFNRIVAASFPRLLDIARELVQSTDMEAWEGLHIIMKTFKHTIYVGVPRGWESDALLTSRKFDLPPHLMIHDQIYGWCSLFLTIVGKEAPAQALDEDLDERERNHYWKSKKWAYANLNRLFVRYVLHVLQYKTGNLPLLNIEKVRKPQHKPEEYNTRNGRVRQIFPRYFCSRYLRRVSARDRQMGVKNSMAQQAVFILHIKLPR